MRSRLAILLWATDVDAPHLCATPFFHAAAAAAMDVEVEMHFASRSVRLLERGIAERLYASDDRTKSIYGHMRVASEFGVRFYACSDALDAIAADRGKLIEETSGIAGAAAFIARAMDPEWSTLVF